MGAIQGEGACCASLKHIDVVWVWLMDTLCNFNVKTEVTKAKSYQGNVWEFAELQC